MMPTQLTDDLRTALDIENQSFYRQFGRYPTRKDPVFWDQAIESDEPMTLNSTPLRTYLEHMSRQVGYPAAEIYAIHKLSRYPKEERTQKLHDEAVEEYRTSAQLPDPLAFEIDEWPGFVERPKLPPPRVHDDDDDIPW